MGMLDAWLGAKCDHCGKRVKTPLRHFGMLKVCEDCEPKLVEEKRARAEENERLRKQEEEEARRREQTIRDELLEAERNRRLSDIHGAAAAGETDAVARLLDGGADVNARDWNERTALMLAASRGREETLRLLLDRGADVNATNKIGWTALHFAAAAGNEAVVRALVEKGADLGSANGKGETPAAVARSKNHVELENVLSMH